MPQGSILSGLYCADKQFLKHWNYFSEVYNAVLIEGQAYNNPLFMLNSELNILTCDYKQAC